MKFSSGKDLLNLAQKYEMPFYQIMLQHESEKNDIREAAIYKRLQKNLDIMKQSVTEPLADQKGRYRGKIIGGQAAKMWEYAQKSPLCGSRMSKAVAYALAASEVNASMGRIVAAPTAGACGVLPAALFTLAETQSFSDEQLLNGLLTAGAIGVVFAKNATISGAVGGCQAEVGVASSMAAAAAVELMGGGPRKILDAAAIAISNLLGLVCDPVAGLVETPCNTRNAIGVSNALLSADLVLSGMQAVVPFDQMVEAMYNVGRNMPPAVKETSLGGMAATPAALAIEKRINKENSCPLING
ncbi:MAG: L-serine ammonia-lyase, iron-sulfur-dependent, subunit alpha [Bacillota bacterium]|jgi:L-serine dehydratase